MFRGLESALHGIDYSHSQPELAIRHCFYETVCVNALPKPNILGVTPPDKRPSNGW